jgi:hypothetical protein
MLVDITEILGKDIKLASSQMSEAITAITFIVAITEESR